MFRDSEAIDKGYMASFKRALAGEVVQMPPTSYDTFRAGHRGRVQDPLIWTETSYFPIYDRYGDLRYVGEINMDVTERVRTGDALQLAREELGMVNAQLAYAARLKDAFLSGMSHELRTPLSVILGLAQVLQDESFGPLEEKQHDYVRNIEASGQRLLTLINNILDFTHIEAGKLNLSIDDAPLLQVCQASLQTVRPQAEAKNIAIEEAIDPAITSVQADQRRMQQMLTMLLDNAIKFTPQGGQAGLTVTGDREQGIVHLVVWDTGIGISPEDQARLFLPFVQVDGRLARNYEGAGLGLALAARLAELHGGSISVESEVGKGSRFVVTLPW
jgi:signal transduction histidine kinase